MSSIALKFGSLVIRTLSKPIANQIKKQAREHPPFRALCISFAQSIHRVDMRWRIGLLQDAAALEKQAKKDAASHAAQEKKANTPTVMTEAEAKAEAEGANKSTEDSSEKNRSKPKIRPLSEAKAIETGANFISETFLFSVAASLILFESWRSRRKETNRREDVKGRLDDLEESEKAARKALIELEHELLRLRASDAKGSIDIQERILPKAIYEEPEEPETQDEFTQSWLTRISSYISTSSTPESKVEEPPATQEPGPAEKILVQSDKNIEEKHRRQDEDDAARVAAASSSKKKS